MTKFLGNVDLNQSSGSEGGELHLAKPETNSTISGNVVIDVYENKLRIFESTGNNRGAYIDLTAATNGVGSNLLGGGGATTLDGLSDVVISSPEEFQSLVYNGTNWVNQHSSVVTYVRNAESTTLTTGTVVYLFGATGDHASVKRADMTSDTTSSKTVGVVAANITASNNGPVITRGYVDGIDLSVGYTAGDILWLGDDGAFTKTKPTAPDHLVFVGVVVRATNNGIIYVACQNGYELDELHNVSLPSPQSGEFLKYNGSLWVADAIDLGTDTTGNYMSGISGTSPVSVSHTPSEGSSATVSLASGYGDTQNPYASKTANFFLAAPNGSAGAPTFRAIVAADIPTLNQSTTGNAATATTLQTSRNINGVAFNGSADITVTAAAGTLTGTTLSSGVTASSLTSVGTLSSLSITGDLTVDTNVLKVDTTNNRVGINVTPQYALDVIGEVSVQSSSWDQDGIRLQGRAGGTSNYDVILTPTTLSATRTLTLPDVTGTVITTGNLSSITSTGTLSSLTSSGTISGQVITGDDFYSPSISLKGWSVDGGWASVESNRGHLLLGHPSNTSGIYLRSNSTSTPVYIGANTTNTLAVGYNGSYALYSVTIDGLAFCNNWWRSTGTSGWYNETYGGGIWMSDSTWIRTYGSKRFVAESGLNVNGTAVTSEPLVVTGNGRVTDSLFFTNYIVADDGVASSGQAAQWLGAFGNWYLVRNSSTLRDKENIQSLGSILTAEMVDDIEVKLWSRKNASGIPEVGPIAEEMDAVSPFLSVRAMDLDENGNVVATEPEGINQNGWLSLLTVALQDAREQIRDLTARIAVLESN